VPSIEFDRAPSDRQLGWFGLIVLAFFGAIGALAWWQLQAPVGAKMLWGTGLALATVYYAIPPLRLAMYLAWMNAVAPIGWLVSHAVLALIYYGVLTPFGLVMRAFRRDQLRLRFDETSGSYWRERDRSTAPDGYFRQS